MNELDIVKLKEDFKGLSAGTKGAIVHVYDSSYYEVEFVDSNGYTIDVLTTPANLIELVTKM